MKHLIAPDREFVDPETVPASQCELRPGVGLCDMCGLPKWPQLYMGYGCMLCLDCAAAPRPAMTAAEHNAFPGGRWS